MSLDRCRNGRTAIKDLSGTVLKLLSIEMFSPSWLISVLCCTVFTIALVFAGNGEDIVIALQMPNVSDCLSLMYYIMDTGFLFQLSMVFVAAFSATAYVRDRENRFGVSILLRTSSRAYLAARVIQCFASAFLSVSVSCVAMILLWKIFLPLGTLSTLVYLVIETAVAFAFWCECGMALSAFIPNKFVAITSPFVMQYIIGRLCFSFLPESLNPTLYLCGSLLAFAKPGEKWLVCVRAVGLFGLLTLFVQGIFFWKANKEIQTGS